MRTAGLPTLRPAAAGVPTMYALHCDARSIMMLLAPDVHLEPG